MKKLINLIALVMLVSTNVLTPYSYADVENPEVIPGSEVETVEEGLGETEEIPEINEETPELVPEEKGEIEQEDQDDVAPENVLPNVQDDEETSATDEIENVNTESEEVAQSSEETPENEIQDEEGKFEELERVKESVVMDIIPGTIVTLLPGTGFNSVIKTLANEGIYVAYTGVDNNIQSFQRVDVEPAGVTTGEISVAGSEYPVYAWFSGGTLYYTTKAEIIQLNENSQQMFYNCSELGELDLSNFKTSNVTNMNGILAGCSKLEEINLSGWDFSKYSISSLMMNMTYGGIPSLNKLNMSNTKYGTSMNYAFGGLTKLEEILLNGVDTSEVNGMYKLFYGLDKIKELDLSSFDTSNVTDMGGMFEYCTNLEAIYVNTGFVTDQVTSSSSMFYGDTNLIGGNGIRYNSSITDKTFARIDKSGQQGYFTDLRNITVKFIFGDAKNEVQNVQYGGHPTKPNNQQEGLPQIKGWVTKDGTSFDFDNSKITKYTELYAKFDTEYATFLPGRDFNMAVKKISGQTGISSEYWDNTGIVQILQRTGNMPSGVTTAVVSEPYSDNDIVAWYDNGIIYYYTEANKIYLNSGSNNMFVNFSNLINIDMTNWDTSKVKTMEKMFFQCASITGLDLGGWDTSNVTSMYDIFRGSNNLRELNLSGWNFTKYCSSLNLSMGLTSNIKKLNMTNTVYSGIMYEFFYSLGGLQELILDGADTSNVTSMEQMFSFNNFTGLDLSSFDTSNVTNMFQMFMGCSKLEELNMSGWDFTHYSWGDSYGSIGSHLYARGSDAPIKKLNLTNVKFGKSLSWAFAYSRYLEEINLDGVDTSNVTDMTRAFYGCPKLTGLDLSSFDTSNVTTMERMFMESNNLKSLDLSNFNTSKVKDTSYMFYNCSGLETLNLSNWDTSSVTNMFNMFYGCKSLINLDLSNFNTSNATNIGNMFNGCNSLKNLNVSNRDTSNVSSSIGGIFQGCSNLETLKMDGWDFRTIGIPSGMLGGTTSLKSISMSGRKIPENFTHGLSRGWGGGGSPIEEIDVTNWDLDQTKDIQGLFADSRELKTLKGLESWDTSNVSNMSNMFGGCSKLTKLDLSSWNTSNVTNMPAIFQNCSGLVELDLSNWDTSNVTNMYSMFYNTPNLKTIYASENFVTTALSGDTSSKDMFSGTVSVIGGNGTKFDSNYIDEEYAKIDKVGQTGYFTDKNAITVKFINTLDGTETLATFAKGQKLTPPSVDKYHVAGGYLDEAMTQAIDLNKGVDAYSVIYVKYDHNGRSGGGGGGGSSKKTDEDTHGSAEDSQKNTQDDKNTENVIQNETKGSEESSNTPMDSSDKSSEGQEILSPSDSSFTKEQKDAYTFAKENGITTKDTIQSAQMNGKLTRIAMAKMLSQYAINVLGKTPDTSKTVKFKDVTSKKDVDYDNGVTLAYQLGIMGQNMPGNNFRPNDEVTRAEFATALSRMAYNTSDGEYKSTSKYYIHHMEKLVNEGIITNDNPNMKELRGYVMIMLMRSAK